MMVYWWYIYTTILYLLYIVVYCNTNWWDVVYIWGVVYVYHYIGVWCGIVLCFSGGEINYIIIMIIMIWYIVVMISIPLSG
jgi:hypothetical protein